MREVGVKIGLYSTRVIEGSFEGGVESKLDFTVQELYLEGSFEGGWSQNWTLQYKSNIGMFGGTFGVKIELTVQEL